MKSPTSLSPLDVSKKDGSVKNLVRSPVMTDSGGSNFVLVFANENLDLA